MRNRRVVRGFARIVIALAVVLTAAFVLPTNGVLRGEEKHASTEAKGEAGEISPAAPPGYVGSNSCVSCHAGEVSAWRGSHHAKAMAVARPENVLGDFSGAVIEHHGATARFERLGDKFIVITDGSDGKAKPFVISHTFGLAPLQQYLVTFPDGRLQALPWAWDSRPIDKGGQRWFHIYGDRPVTADSPLHWTRGQQNWNFMCAECHSTAVNKNYDAAADNYRTIFSEISVGCESCHGSGQNHIAWAQSPSAVDRLKGFAASLEKRPSADWTADAASGSPAHGVARPMGDEVEMCARCHSRRSTLSEDWKPGRPLSDTHIPALLTEGLFESDGQMIGEVFNDQSFKLSRMYAKGVTCGDCHNPHSGKLKAAGAAVCGQCHLPQKFASQSHTGHAPGPKAPDCVSCHMPTRTYMVVDSRHDHSFRIPRPDLSAKLRTPNTCSVCHSDHSAAWAAEAIMRWHGPDRKGYQTFGEAFDLARGGDPAARDRLLKYVADLAQPAIARATALTELDRFPSAARNEAVSNSLADPDPVVRAAALRGLEGRTLEVRLRLAFPLAADPVLAVRREAARLLADTSLDVIAPSERGRLQAAFTEFEATQRLNADRPEGRAVLGDFFVQRRDAAAAEAEYIAGLKLEPTATALAVNLADLYRQTGREAEAEQLLRRAISLSPEDAAAHHALGLNLVRGKRYAEALPQFRRAAELGAWSPRYAYVYGVALQFLGQVADARAAWERGIELTFWDPSLLGALLDDAMRRRDFASARDYAARLVALNPDDRELARLAEQLAPASGVVKPGGEPQ